MTDTTTTPARLEFWKQLLVEGCAPLLDLDAAAIVALPDVDAVRIAVALAAGSAFTIEADVEAATGPASYEVGRLRSPLTGPDLARRLTALRRAARAAETDLGAHALYLGLGVLVWRDATGTTRRAPLWLQPVELERRETGGLRLVASKLEATFNHALGDTLERDHELVLARSLDLAALLEAVSGATVTRPGWSVERGACLAALSLAPSALLRDLDQLGDALLGRPLVAQLVSPQPPLRLPLGAAAPILAPLDADAAQLAAIAAAGAGGSFVLAAPPGTGASQTIANIVVHAAANGSSVLVVSERRAALEAVRARLDAVGLGEICLDLHAPRADVLAGLARVLDRAFRPGAGPSGADERLAELRTTLDRHAAALHAHGPFGRSLHEVIGRLVELRSTPNAELAEVDAAGLDRATFEKRLVAVGALAVAALPVEPVATHPWRTSTLAGCGGDARDLAAAALDEATEAAAALATAVAALHAIVPGVITRTPAQLEALGALAAIAATSARPGAELVGQVRAAYTDELGEQLALIRARGAGALDVPRDPAAFLAIAARHRKLVAALDERFSDRVEDLDAPALWAQLKRWTGRVAPLRFVALRAARAEVAAASAIPTAAGGFATDDAMIEALEDVIAERACRKALAAASEPARRWFGDLAEDPMVLDLERVESAVAWASELRRAFDALALAGGDAGRQAAWRALVAQVASGPGAALGAAAVDAARGELAAFARLAEAVARWRAALGILADATGVPRETLGDKDDHLTGLREQLAAWRHAVDALPDWARFYGARRAAVEAGVGPAVRAIERGDLGAAELAPAWERATLLAWSDAEVGETPALAEFHGPSHHAQVAAFADLDRGALALARARALVRIAERVPRVARGTRTTGDEQLDAEIFALHAAAMATPQPPLHDALAALPALLPRLAPCVLASPAEVAQHLAVVHRFALVVVDEAGPLPTARALGSLARGDAAVIVGDAALLQPAAGAGLYADALAAGFPELQLGTHYRSRHEDVFATANTYAYGDRICVLPAPAGSPDLGVTWRQVDAAGEAAAVAAEVLARLRDPAQRARSLAVVTLSRELASTIEDALDGARATEPALAALLDAATEPVLVKYVDAAQGDERDVVILATGTPAARVTASARQMAVALTRAREQLVVMTSFAPEDLAVDVAPGLAAVLELARAGRAAPVDDDVPASPVTAALARALVERGWLVRHRVGAGAYRVDLAVVDPADPARHVLAIEHDGATYAQAATARERDRLRAQVLTQLGWRVHRVWSMDWWLDPEAEIQRAHGAIVAAIAASRQRRAPAAAPRARTTRPPATAPAASTRAPLAAGSAPIPRAAVAASTAATPRLAAGSGPAVSPLYADATPELVDHAPTTPVKLARGAIAIGPYLAATIPAGRRSPDDLFAARYVGELGKIIEQVLAAEAPMHVDLLSRRVGAYFGIGRVTQRVTDQVRGALVGRGRAGDEQDVIWRLDQDPEAVPPVRVAGAGHETKREIGDVPLSELAAAARIVVERVPAIGTTELVRDAARLLGFARLTDQVTDRVQRGIRLAQMRELIAIDDAGRARVPRD